MEYYKKGFVIIALSRENKVAVEMMLSELNIRINIVKDKLFDATAQRVIDHAFEIATEAEATNMKTQIMNLL